MQKILWAATLGIAVVLSGSCSSDGAETTGGPSAAGGADAAAGAGGVTAGTGGAAGAAAANASGAAGIGGAPGDFGGAAGGGATVGSGGLAGAGGTAGTGGGAGMGGSSGAGGVVGIGGASGTGGDGDSGDGAPDATSPTDAWIERAGDSGGSIDGGADAPADDARDASADDASDAPADDASDASADDAGDGSGECPVATTPCYAGPPGTAGVGVCTSGVSTCVAGVFGACIGDVTPSPESCNGLDDDCNGSVDEGDPGGGGSCDTGLVGVCAAGTTHCNGGGLTCTQNQAAGVEICNGLDDNCDGSVDEGLTQSCYQGPGGTSNVGLCHVGQQTCSYGSWGPCVGEVVPAASEICDGADNDCDGQIDEGDPGGGGSCNTGLLGVCAAGTTHCSGGGLTCTQNQAAGVEICNGLDDNCDGAVDEGGTCTPFNLVSATATGDGEIAATFSAPPASGGGFCITDDAPGITDCSAPTLAVGTSVISSPDPNTVILSTGQQTKAQAYRLYVTGLVRASDNAPLQAATAAFAGFLVGNGSFEADQQPAAQNASAPPASWTMVSVNGAGHLLHALPGDGGNGVPPAARGLNVARFDSLISSIGGREARSDCFPVDPARTVAASYQVWIPVGQSTGGTRAAVKLWYYSDAACTVASAVRASDAQTSASNLAVGDWERRVYGGNAPPADAIAARVSIRAQYVIGPSCGSGDCSQDLVYFDDIVVAQP